MLTTILTCTGDSRSTGFERHARSVKAHSSDYEWIIIDNNHSSEFNHSREINRAMSIASGRYLVLLDDDVIVSGGWLDGLCAAAGNAEVVGGIHRHAEGGVNHSGGYVLSDGSAGHFIGPVVHSLFVQYVCSAVMLIDLAFARRENLRFNERYAKFFLETDYCLRVWGAGGRVAVSGGCNVVHLIGGGMAVQTDRAEVYRRDSQYFKADWVASGKLEAVMVVAREGLDRSYSDAVASLSRLYATFGEASRNLDRETLQAVRLESGKFLDYYHGWVMHSISTPVGSDAASGDDVDMVIFRDYGKDIRKVGGLSDGADRERQG